MLFASDGPDTPTTSRQAPATIQRQTSASPTTQPLTPATPCPWLITGRPPQSIQELFIPNITADKSNPVTALSITSSLVPVKPQSRLSQPLISGPWPTSTKLCGRTCRFSEKNLKEVTSQLHRSYKQIPNQLLNPPTTSQQTLLPPAV